MTWVLLLALLLSELPPWVSVAFAAATADPGDFEPPPLVLTRTNVSICRAVPKVDTPGKVPTICADPSDELIGRLRLFPQRILPVPPPTAPGGLSGWVKGLFSGSSTSPQENPAALVGAIEQLQTSKDPYLTKPLMDYVTVNPSSRWRPALRFELHRRQYNEGFLLQAETGWLALWNELKTRTDSGAVAIVDNTLSHLLDLCLGLGRLEQLEALIGAQETRPANGILDAKVRSARQALWLYRHNPGHNVRCGPVALHSILDHLGQQYSPIPLSPFTDEFIATGIPLTRIRDYADLYGLKLKMAKRTVPGSIPVPAVMHLECGHFSAVLAREGDRYLFSDKGLHFTRWVPQAALDSLASGYFLVPTEHQAKGWALVSDDEGSGVFGRHNLHGQQPTDGSTGDDDPRAGGNGCSDDSDGYGMPVYWFHPSVASLHIDDIPIGYQPPVGPAVYFRLAYNDLDISRPADAPAFSNVGRLWSINWVRYIDHFDGTLEDGAPLKTHLAGGGTETSYFNTATRRFGPSDSTFSTVTRSGSHTYTRLLADGSTEIYDLPDNPAAPTRVFLTRQTDPAGNAIDFTYDSDLRLVAVTDALGQVTRLSYQDASDSSHWLVRRVEDPFGRTAVLDYDPRDSHGNLRAVTDVVGLTSSFRTVGDKVTTMGTPYGTTVFRRVDRGNSGGSWDLSVTATDPLGGRERVQYIEPIEVPEEIPPLPERIPVGTSNVVFHADTGRQPYRNSFYWTKKAMAETKGNPTAARNYRWYTDFDYKITAIIESVKEPLEGRIWYNYPGYVARAQDGKEYAYYGGSGRLPEKTLRLLADGTPQLVQTYRNSRGKPTVVVDPLGRTTLYRYAANDIDLLEVRQVTGPDTSDLLLTIGYDQRHLPLAITNAARQVTRFTYNAQGQVQTVTDALGHVTTYAYKDGYLTGIDGPLLGSDDTLYFTYDPFGRVRSITGTDGYTLVYDYDDLDRLTRITYPGSTEVKPLYEQFVYDRLDLVAVRDRAGRFTRYDHDNLRRLTRIQDPLDRVTRFQWCDCGSPKALIDAMDRMTSWRYDIQGRLTTKIWADGSQIAYHYDAATGWLRQRVDEKEQTTNYEYTIDGLLRQTEYPNALVPTATVTYGYDAWYPRAQTAEDGIGLTTFSYNPVGVSPGLGAGELGAVDGPYADDAITYQYDELGRITSRTVAGASEITLYDALSRPTMVTNLLGTFTYSYDGATRRVTSVDYPEPFRSTYTYYDNPGDRRLREITHQRGPEVFCRFAYEYDDVGNITTWLQETGGPLSGEWKIDYDGADQLLSVDVVRNGRVVRAFRYGYDSAGNRTVEDADGTRREFTYNILNELTAIVGESTGQRSYEWDAENRLARVEVGDTRLELTHDYLGRSVRIVERTGTQIRSANEVLWDGLTFVQLSETTVGTRAWYVVGGTYVQADAETVLMMAFDDHLETPRASIGNGGPQAVVRDYGPWGTLAMPSSERTGLGLDFTGHLASNATGMLLAPYRVYSPSLGRWLSRDPVFGWLEIGGNRIDWQKVTLSPQVPASHSHLYSYVRNNPLNARDPSGLWTIGIGGQLGVAAPFSGGPIGASGGFSMGLFLGYDRCAGWSWDLLASHFIGVGVGGGVSLGAFGQMTDAGSVEELKGPGIRVGGSASPLPPNPVIRPFAVGYDSIAGIGGSDYSGSEISGSFGIGLPVEAHAGGTYSYSYLPLVGR